LDLLESENAVLRGLFAKIHDSRGPSVEDRYDYGNSAKEIIRHLAVRQSSLMNVAAAIASTPALRSTGARMSKGGTDRRRAYDEVGDMSRNVEVMNLDQGQDFDGPLMALIDTVAPEIDWELADAIPLIRSSMTTNDFAARFCSARYAQRHAPSRLSVKGPRWYERAPIISRVMTLYDRLNDYLASSHDKRRS
jgi:hypothetical protein